MLLAAVTLWNARSYPPDSGYDAEAHIAYADGLVERGEIPGPEERSEYYTPPGFYAIAGAATQVGRLIGLKEPRHVAQALNALAIVATALLVLALALILWPGRRVPALAALGFFASLPVVAKTGAMFHPEPLSLFLSSAALALAAFMLARRRFELRLALALGLLLGAGQLVRAFSLWTYAAVVLAFLAAAFVRTAPRGLVLRSLASAVAVAAVVAAPWYVRQALHYSNPIFDPEPTEAAPLWERRPASFYVDPGLPEVVTKPYRPAFTNRGLPTTYSELWGDWEGYYAWEASEEPRAGVVRQLRAQNLLGLVPSVLALAGWLALLPAAIRRRHPAALLVALLPGLGLLGYAYFTISYPTPDGDVLKATYMLTTAPAWALAFGFALDRLWERRRLRVVLLALLALGALVNLRFLVYGSPLGGLL